MPSLSINDIQMHYEHHPRASSVQLPLLMIPGMASDSFSWQPIVHQLASHYELVMPDNRCTGRTSPNPVPTSRDHYVNDMLALLDCLKIDRVNILGHSMGGMIGWAIAEQAPDRVNHLICSGAQASAIPARLSLFNTLSALRTDENDAHWFELFYQFLFSPSFFENSAAVSQAVEASIAYPYKQSRSAFATQTAALESFLPAFNLESIRCSVSLVTGANDLLMTPALLQVFCEQHGYPFTVIPDAAHALHWEQPEAVTEYVLSELRAHASG